MGWLSPGRRHGGRHVAGTLIVHLHALHEPDTHTATEAHQSIVDDPKCVRAATGDNHAPTAGGVVDVDAATRVAGSVVGLRVHLKEAEVVFNVQLTGIVNLFPKRAVAVQPLMNLTPRQSKPSPAPVASDMVEE